MEVKQVGRTKKAVRNMSFNFMFKFLDIALSFVLRSVFIHVLSTSYLGINGLFTNMLTVLSLMEGGLGSAIVFSLYKPLAEGDNKKVASLMQLYKKTYIFLGVSIITVGFLLTPLLPYIVNLPENIEHITLIYWLTVINTGTTYFLSYRRSLLIADQNSYINTKNQMFFRFTRCILLILMLVITKNYIAYLVAEMINSLVSNIHITYKVKKLYRNVENTKPEKLEKSEKKRIVNHMSSGIMFKIGQTVVNSTDSILISILISTTMVGIYSNYNLIFSNMDIFVYMIFSGLTASVGNFVVQKDAKSQKELFDKLFLINYLIVSVITVCIFCLATPFVELWLGREFILDTKTLLVICINFYVTSMCNCSGNFLMSQGDLYYKNRFSRLIEAVSNLVFSVIFTAVFDMGLMGIFLGTTVCFVVGRMWMDPLIIYKHLFRVPFADYVKKYAVRVLLCAGICIPCKLITGWIFDVMSVTVLSWVICGIVCAGTMAGTLTLLYRNTEEFAYIINLLKKLKR